MDPTPDELLAELRALDAAASVRLDGETHCVDHPTAAEQPLATSEHATERNDSFAAGQSGARVQLSASVLDATYDALVAAGKDTAAIRVRHFRFGDAARQLRLLAEWLEAPGSKRIDALDRSRVPDVLQLAGELEAIGAGLIEAVAEVSRGR
jgi:hypothetical protein